MPRPTRDTDSRDSRPPVLRKGSAAERGDVVSVRDAKAHLSALLDWVAAGHELTITSDGRPKARLVGPQAHQGRKTFKGMGRHLTRQPIHHGAPAERVVRNDRDARDA